MKKHRTGTRLLFCAGLLGLLLGGTACAARSGPIAAQVLDAQTGQPIPGAIVLGVWTTKGEGIFGAHAPTKLAGVKEVETDVQGRFTLERPGMVAEEDESITVYKFGYVAWSNLFLWPTSKRREDSQVPAQILLQVFPEGSDRRRHISFISGATRGGDNSRDTPKFFQAVQREWERR
jgi:hypothetical protein